MAGTTEVSWPELLAHPAVAERLVCGSRFGLLSYHAGLEAGTGEIAAAAAGASGASWYSVEQPADLRWHVASAGVDAGSSALLAQFLAAVDTAVALHGYGRRGVLDPVLLGGSNRHLASALADALAEHLPAVAVVEDLDAIPVRLRGVHPANPVNLPPFGGVQVELPVVVRDRHREEVAAALAAVAATAGTS